MRKLCANFLLSLQVSTKMQRVAITTLGCKVNQYEGAILAEYLRRSSYRVVPFGEEAEVYVINTCTVTQRSDYQSRQLIRRAIRLNPKAKIVVTGCYAQVAPQEIEEIPGVSYVVGEKQEIINLIKNDQPKDLPQKIINNISFEASFKEFFPEAFAGRTRAFLKIQDGCDSFCSYCIVPYARGRNRSLPPNEVLCRILRLVEAGFKEIVLTGIHLGSYGLDLNPPSTFLSLLRLIEKEERFSRIRLSSIEPGEFSPELIDFLSNSRCICPHLHIPLQSGDEGILKRMRRPYTPSYFMRLVEDLVAKIPDLAIGVDVMVGFPGEGEEEFTNTYNLLHHLPLSYLHIFPYSRRPGTLAANFPRQIDPKTAKKRVEILKELDTQKRERFYRRFLGRKVLLLVEGKRDKESNKLKGISRNYIPVLIDSGKDLKNGEIEIIINKVEKRRVFGIFCT